MANPPPATHVAGNNISDTASYRVPIGDPLSGGFMGNYMVSSPMGHVSNPMVMNPMSNNAMDQFPMAYHSNNSSMESFAPNTPPMVDHPMMSNTARHQASLSHGPSNSSSKDLIANALMASAPMVNHPTAKVIMESSTANAPSAWAPMANPQMLPTPSTTPIAQTAAIMTSLPEWRRASPPAMNGALQKAAFRAQFVVGSRKDEGVWLCKKCVTLLRTDLFEIDDHDVRVAIHSFEVENNLRLGCIEHDEAEPGTTRCKFCKKRLMCRFCIRLPDGFRYDFSTPL